MKHLIVNADDFGLSKEINEGIIECHRNGVVTSTSIVASAEAFDDAVKLAKHNKTLGVGIHLTLIEEYPVLMRDEIETLTKDSGIFLSNYREFFIKLLSFRISLKEIRKEFEAQIEKICKSGLKLSHIDSHQHIHLFPPILKIVIELALKYKIKWIRILRSDFPGIKYYPLEILSALASKKIRQNGLFHADRLYGIQNSGHLDKSHACKIIERIGEGMNELICHPGENTEKISGKYHWNYDWDMEYNTLRDKNLKKIIAERGIKLINYDKATGYIKAL